MPPAFARLTLGLVCLAAVTVSAADGNRLAYLDGPLDPYYPYPHRDFPKLTTPQWVGEEGVECVVTLAIDDMRDSSKYETFLRPILNRLKAIDGRAALSIMSCRVDPADPQLQAWLKEGLSIEVHTFDHPCPLLQDGGLAKAKETYDKCVDLMSQIPGNKPVAFRMPCCDSKNTPSPRFWAEVFNKTTEKGNFLQIDSSVFNIITNKDKSLPKEITELPGGEERFRRYVPFANFVNTIEDYPYPYVIGGMCWEFPCVVPSDWSANHVQQPNNPDTLRDWKLALDACMLKQGTFNLVFHPHGWIRNDQIIELIDHAVTKHGKKVKFLNFRECAERLNKNLLVRGSIREGDKKTENAFFVDLNQDGFLDVDFEGGGTNDAIQRIWNREKRQWDDTRLEAPPGLGVVRHSDIYHHPMRRDLDGDGSDEAFVEFDSDNEKHRTGIFPFGGPQEAVFYSPLGTFRLDAKRRDAGMRLIDVNNDGKLDCLFSNHERYSLHLFKDMKEGWAIKVIEGVRGKEGGVGPVIPPFVRADGTNNGAWFHSGALWLMNEDTWRLPDNVFKLTFAEMLGKSEVRGQKSEVGKKVGCCGEEVVGDEIAADNVLGTKYSVLGTQYSVRRPAESKPAVQLVSQPPASSPQPRASGTAPSGDFEMTPPRSPEDSLKALHVHPGMKVELVAAEPLIVDPVAFDWGPDGRLWVVEMRDYPNGITWKKEGDEFGKPGGRVKVLTDVDGDGKYDKAAIFLDEIPFPTGIKVWRKGILVTAAPEIFYAEDKDGDDKADERKVLYRGFGEGNQQHRVNGLRWGLDNWLYVGNGDSGGVIKSLDALIPTRHASEATEVNVNGRDLRIRPDTGELDPTSGNTQFGRERDDWGNWFGGNNSDPMWHYVLDDYYLRRNPYATYPPIKKDVSIVPGASPVFPRSKTQKRFNDDNKANRYTSACSPIIYRDDLLGPEYYGNMFVCEPVHNLVGHEIVSPQGATFTSKRAADEQMSEFLASEDNWFRPSMCRTGPDGALWVADMYRFVIEHPKWIPPAAQAKFDLRAGDDKGRIYRIYPANTKPRPIARLDQLDTAGLVAALDSPNGPQRDLVQQMLIWRGDKSAVEPLQKLAGGSKRPQTRLQAICTLDGMAALDPIGLVILSSDPEPAVRRHVLRLSEPWLGKDSKVTDAVSLLAFDEDITVRMQAAYSLSQWKDNRAARILATLMLKIPSDRYVTAAALSSITKDSVGEILRSVLAADDAAAKEKLVERLLALAAAMGQDAAAGQALITLLRPQADGSFAASQFTTLANTMDALVRGKSSLTRVLDETGRQRISAILASARTSVGQEGGQALPLQVAATSVLARGIDGQDAADVKLLASLLAPRKPPELHAAAVTALVRTARATVPALLFAGWQAHSPSLRNQILDAMATREIWALEVLDAVEQGKIAASQLDARRRQQFLSARSKAVRDRAEKVLAGSIDPNRQKLLETYLPVAAKGGGDVARGKAVYAKRCANCHKLEGAGYSVGPDLAALTSRPADYLLTSILDPNRAVEDRYLEYVVLTTDGRQVNGILLEETGASLTLAAPEGKQVVISRSELEQMKSSGKSLMPEGVEKDVSPAEMANLLAYLKSTARPPKVLALNKPEVVQAFNDGSIRLFATSCRAYGSTIKMEETYKALGWWNSQDDYCAWSFDVPAGGAGEYRVTLEYSCDDNSAGNTAVVEAAGQSLSGQVASSGGWDKYRGWNFGSVTLPEGRNEIVVRSSGPIKRALFDLGGVKLVPAK